MLNGYPRKVEVGLIGSCTNSSYEDLARAASIARQALEKDVAAVSSLIINPGSEQLYETTDRDGLINLFKEVGATILANASGPWIGQWQRFDDDTDKQNTIIPSYMRNFTTRDAVKLTTFALVAPP